MPPESWDVLAYNAKEDLPMDPAAPTLVFSPAQIKWNTETSESRQVEGHREGKLIRISHQKNPDSPTGK